MADYDVIDHPSHYAEGRKYEPIDVFIDWGLGPLEWQVCKYLSRLGRKGSALEDSRKAQFYMNRLVEELEFNKKQEPLTPEQLEDLEDIEAAAEAREEPRFAGWPISMNRIAPEAVNIHFDMTDIDPEALRVIIGDDFPEWP